jgi:ribosomal protein S18 acetylase RimI-like enzyme
MLLMQTPPVRLSPEHYDEIRALWEAAGLSVKPHGRDSRSAFAAQLTGGLQVALGVRDGEQLIGVALATHDGRKGWINRLAVHPDFRRQRVASRLIEACEELFAEKGIGVYAALVHDHNAASLAAFEREGYRLNQDILYLTKRIEDGT